GRGGGRAGDGRKGVGEGGGAATEGRQRVRGLCRMRAPTGGGTHPLGVLMRVPPLLAAIFLVALLASSSWAAVTMAWTPVGNPGNACDPQSQGCFGSVSYEYRVGTYEVTNAQYAEFLNAKAASDPLGLYDMAMGDPQGYGG